MRDRMQHIALDMSAYSYGRITVPLQREGFHINQKRVLRFMREDNLRCVCTRPFVHITNAGHTFPLHPNLVPRVEVSGLNQRGIADST